ncbi:MAG TPA: hypothetical protein VJM31_07815 [Vicinamibacterales bacterium]|nr:hypothetical protein [Vicinamibacterales bacterium]
MTRTEPHMHRVMLVALASGLIALGSTRCGSPVASPSPSSPSPPSDPSPAPPPTSSGTLRVGIKGGGPNSVAPGRTLALSAVLEASDGSTPDVTAEALWQSSNPSAATVVAGVVSAHVEAVVDIRATYRNVSAQAQVDIRHHCNAAASSIVPPTSRLAATESYRSVQVTVAFPDCRWFAIADGPLMHDIYNPSASGNGGFQFDIGPNNLPKSRTGRVRIFFPDQSSLVHDFSQAQPPCSYVVEPAERLFNVPGGKGSFRLRATPETCEWVVRKPSVRPDDSLTITSAGKGRGSANLTYQIVGHSRVKYRIAVVGPDNERESPAVYYEVHIQD